MTITIYGIKTCDTCRKALKALPEAEFRDIRTAPLNDDERTEFLDAFGASLINRASTTWRGLAENERANPAESLLATYPTLMKRPVIRVEDRLYLGWKADTRSALGIG